MNASSAPSRRAPRLLPALVVATGWLAFVAPVSQAAPLPPLTKSTPSAPTPGSGGPKRPGPVVAPTTDPAEASVRQGGPRRPTGIAPIQSQPQDLTTAERFAQP